MTLRELFGDAARDTPEVEVTALAYDNRRVAPGAVFFCVRGFTRDGHDFAADAVQRGAVALVVDHPLEVDVPQILVEDVRAAMAPAAARLHGDPTATLRTIGVTGTNGKTTTAYLVRALLEAAGEQTGLLGTVTSIVGGVEHPVARTTPEAIDLQATFAAMRDGGDSHCVMEVSSHALALGRADAIHWAAAIFTNLTQDHLDFHPTMEEYFAAKCRLFVEGRPRVAVVNVDDPYGARLANEIRGAVAQLVTVAIDAPDADLRATEIDSAFTGSTFSAGELRLRSPLPGRFNVMNVLGAVAAVRALGVDDATIVAALPEAGRVPGRFEPVDEGQDFAVLVDYAHTPDSLENVLAAARPLTAGRLVCVFGCGGDRDRGKRPQMGAISARLADHTIVTSDNPRSEDPAAIVEQILAGIEDRSATEAIVDRHAAIERAVQIAGPGDVVVIAGKGHEQGQEFEGGRKLPFDDVSVAQEALRARLVA
ncbi:MAG: UDP-N-acetylmuramoylalanyl-D-glutamate--2,6-diaminopimelate ligase [uncultured Solirubrobacteraceae bacterium]|uniref:UDP-N-acetylmuramoyl-L-alanyl-D-glutamate--2,6-diaminopimelate ligase n=1 Tax=uncultured Solirubrobacteraceae bacterium TaxID=1162706 RepID=A0A6J4TWE3_9ACTN|nr:MAG: UDP-N-acetylmuramoylalanyl-D-glutamate--2,6-diaminopimelate ligase [uncultured Solirubrobacteraceae bacterium]